MNSGVRKAKTRWELSIRTVLGEKPVVLVARDGEVYVTGPGMGMLNPAEISFLRQTLAEVQAEALRQRGGF